jgi:predicted GTPase
MAKSTVVVAVVGPSGHGKTSLVDALPGVPVSPLTLLTARAREIECTVDGRALRLLDTPGQADLSADAGHALAGCGAVVVVVDAGDGLLAPAARLLAAATAASSTASPSRPLVLVLTNMDRLLRCGAHEDAIYDTLSAAVDGVANATGTQIGPEQLVFTSAVEGWGFRLSSFAEIHAERFKQPADRLLQRLWGENFWEPQWRKWVRKRGERLEKEKADFRQIWSGWLLLEVTAEMRFRRYWFVLEKNNLSWFAQPSDWNLTAAGSLRGPGPKGMLTLGGDSGYGLQPQHDTLEGLGQAHTFALCPLGQHASLIKDSDDEDEDSEADAFVAQSDVDGEEGAAMPLRQLILAAASAEEREGFLAKCSSQLGFIQRREKRLAGELDDQLPRRGFCQLILEPLLTVSRAALREQRSRLAKLLEQLKTGCSLPPDIAPPLLPAARYRGRGGQGHWQRGDGDV